MHNIYRHTGTLLLVLGAALVASCSDIHQEDVPQIPQGKGGLFRLVVSEPQSVITTEPWTKASVETGWTECSAPGDDFAMEMSTSEKVSTKAGRINSFPSKIMVEFYRYENYYSDYDPWYYQIAREAFNNKYDNLYTGTVHAPIVCEDDGDYYEYLYVVAWAPFDSPNISAKFDSDDGFYLNYVLPNDLSKSDDYCYGRWADSPSSYDEEEYYSANITMRHPLVCINITTKEGAVGTLKEIALEKVRRGVTDGGDAYAVSGGNICTLACNIALNGSAGQTLVGESLGNEFFVPANCTWSESKLRIKVDRGNGDEYLYAGIDGKITDSDKGKVKTFRITIPAGAVTWTVTPELLEWEADSDALQYVTVTGSDLSGLQASLRSGSHWYAEILSNTGTSATVEIRPQAANTLTTDLTESLTLTLGTRTKTVSLVHKGSTGVIIIVH